MSQAHPPAEATTIRRGIRVVGVVQGVGFRPHVFALARSLLLAGHVGNDESGVFIEVQGPADVIAYFERAVVDDAPPLSRIDSVASADLPLLDVTEGSAEFVIVASRDASVEAADGSAGVPPDTATCADCLSELLDPSNRRYRYPFIACTHCGPRLTLVTGVPYDRPSTTMADFPLCDPCEREYVDPANRRFHAQPTACANCGPQLTFVDPRGSAAVRSYRDEAVADLLDSLSAGAIAAVKGMGGYHLVCDADNPMAVQTLRERKARGAKPFAVMVRDLAAAEQVCEADEASSDLLRSAAAPIVLLQARDAALQASVAPGNGRLGVMLPYTGLHHLLFAAHPRRPAGWRPRVLVMTSANLADEPLCIDEAEAEERLAGIADVFCHHDRRIHTPCDDSVVTRRTVVRRSRGYAPLSVRMPFDVPPLLAVGGEIKTTACLANGRQAWLTQHVGDTGNLLTLQMLERIVTVAAQVQRVSPGLVVADAHPAYQSRRWAREWAEQRGAPFVQVQHHHAHMASLLAEHLVPAGEQVLVFAFDGTGYGVDGTAWGGEVLLGSYAAATRIGHLTPVSLPGGDAAVRRPARTALAHLRRAGVAWEDDLPSVAACDGMERRVVDQMLRTGTGCALTTSAGRLFDAAASILGVRHAIDYEGQAAVELEALAGDHGPAWECAVESANGRHLIDTAPLVAACAAAVRRGLPVSEASYAVHAALADAIAAVADAVAHTHGVRTVGLTGGVFANDLLSALCRGRLGALGVTVLEHRLVPANDGGLALGQAAVAAAGGAFDRVEDPADEVGPGHLASTDAAHRFSGQYADVARRSEGRLA